MRAGNQIYSKAEDIPAIIPLFPLDGAVLLPHVQISLNIFESRYVAMVDAALAGDRIIGMIQNDISQEAENEAGRTGALCRVGCAGRIVTLEEAGDGRYLIALSGIARFRLVGELSTGKPFRSGRVSFADFASDLVEGHGEQMVDRHSLIETLQKLVKIGNIEIDWDSISSTTSEKLVNSLAMMCPCGAAEKQALLEARDLSTRAQTVITLTEMFLFSQNSDGKMVVQ